MSFTRWESPEINDFCRVTLYEIPYFSDNPVTNSDNESKIYAEFYRIMERKDLSQKALVFFAEDEE